MKSFEELMGDLEEEITDEEIDKEIETMLIRAKIFIAVNESRDKEQRIFMLRLSQKLNDLFKAGCNSKQLIKVLNLELKEIWKTIK